MGPSTLIKTQSNSLRSRLSQMPSTISTTIKSKLLHLSPFTASTIASPTATNKSNRLAVTSTPQKKQLPNRIIYINRPVPSSQFSTHTKHYCTNAITTSHYNIINFLPKNLFQQFHRAANLYFLILIVVQLVPYFAIGSPFLTVLPLLVVLGITAIKDAVEDWRRHVSDAKFNKSQTIVIATTLTTTTTTTRRSSSNSSSNQDSAAGGERSWWNYNIDPIVALNKKIQNSLWVRIKMLSRKYVDSLLSVTFSTRSVQNNNSGALLSWGMLSKVNDNKDNGGRVKPRLKVVQWKDVRVGDVVYLRSDDPVPADLLLLSTSRNNGECFVETKNLDGETNLNIKRAPLSQNSNNKSTDLSGGVWIKKPEDILDLVGKAVVDPPSSNMFSINGSISVFPKPAATVLQPKKQLNVKTESDDLHSSEIEEYDEDFSRQRRDTLFNSPNDEHNSDNCSEPNSQPENKGGACHSRTCSNATIVESVDNGTPVHPPFRQNRLLSLGNTITNGYYPGKPKTNLQSQSSPITIPFSSSNILLRGMTLKNTQYVYGLVLYTGNQTKIVLNSGNPTYKRSRLELLLNKQIIFNAVFLFIVCLVCSIIGGLMFTRTDRNIPGHPFVASTQSPFVYSFLLFWLMLINYQYIIPISLYVSVEIVKAAQAFFIYQDVNMYYEPTKQRCIPRNWNISDDMGQVSFVFSDKTGTLTRNIMDFRMCSVYGKVYGQCQLPGYELDVVKSWKAKNEVDCNNPEQNWQSDQQHGVEQHSFASPLLSLGFMNSNDDLASGDVDKKHRNSISSMISDQLRLSFDVCGYGSPQNNHAPNVVAAATANNNDHSPGFSSIVSEHLRATERVQLIQIQEQIELQNQDSPPNRTSNQKVDPIIVRETMIRDYVTAINSVFTPKYIDISNSINNNNNNNSNSRQYNFVDPEIWYDLGGKEGQSSDYEQSKRINLFLTQMAVCHTVLADSPTNSDSTTKADDVVIEIDSNHQAQPKQSQQRLDDSLLGNSKQIFWKTVKSIYTKLVVTHKEPEKISLEGIIEEFPIESSANTSSTNTGEFLAPEYNSESPDESALVDGARNLGYTFLGRSGNTLTVDILGQRYGFELLEAIPFDSTRKRMSTIVRRPAPWNDIILFTKGADNVMLPLLKPLQSPPSLFEGENKARSEFYDEAVAREKTIQQVDEFASAGLRTLILAYKQISESEFKVWSKRYNQAKSITAGSTNKDGYYGSGNDVNRLKAIDQVVADIERDLWIVGATAIEDKLQEKVPESIAAMRKAGINIWVLTGDKMETAINIGYASNLLTKDMELWTLKSTGGDGDGDGVIREFDEIYEKIIKRSGISGSNDSLNTTKTADTTVSPTSSTLPFNIDNVGSLSDIKKDESQLWPELVNEDEIVIINDTKESSTPVSNNLTPNNDNGSEHHSDDEYNVQKDIEGIINGLSISDEFKQKTGNPTTSTTPPTSSSSSSSSQYQNISPPNKPKNSLILDGKALQILSTNPTSTKKLQHLAASHFDSVICCHCSPLQKALMVNIIKTGIPSAITLAIGDGANDVSMIQAAHIGIAISGEEGLQAANASDYTIGRFHYLQNLLFVHGFNNYLRISEMILSFFYKNVIWAIAPLWFQIFCRFSAEVFYEYTFIQIYNNILTSVPIVMMAVWDKPFNYKTGMKYIGIYRSGNRNVYFRWIHFLVYMSDGVWQSFVCFFGFYLATYSTGVFDAHSGHTLGEFDFSTMVTIAIVICANLVVGLNSWSWNWTIWASVYLSIGVCFLVIIISSTVEGAVLQGACEILFGNLSFWLILILTLLVAIGPRFVVKAYHKLFVPFDVDIVREIRMLDRKMCASNSNSCDGDDSRYGCLSVRHSHNHFDSHKDV